MKSYNGTGNHRMESLRLRRASLRNHLAEEQDCSCHMCTRNIMNLKKKGKDSKEERKREKLQRGEVIVTREREEKRRERTSGRKLIASSSMTLEL
jgi:hypothetical protein